MTNHKGYGKPPGFQALEDWRAGMESLWSGQIQNWQRFWQRLENGDYSVGSWTSDVARFWGSWMNGVMNLSSSPLRQSAGDTVPTVMFLLDEAATGKPPSKEIVLPSSSQSGGSFEYLKWSGDTPPNVRDKLKMTFESLDGDARLKIDLNPVSELKIGGSPWPSQTHLLSLVYQNRTPIAGVFVGFR
jgi:hypothetical protein